MKLVQKSLFRGSQTFELLDDEVRISTKTLFNAKQKSVPLAILNPEPELDASHLHFHSRVKCGPLLSFALNKPNKAEFDAFVGAVKERALKEFNAFAGLK